MSDKPYIICGWFTLDYSHWANLLRANLDDLGEQHDFVEVPIVAGGWERNTLRKPELLRHAMQVHSGKTIVFLDVDCAVNEPLDDLADIHGDIGLHFRSKQARNGQTRLSIRSGTIVAKQTEPAMRFVRSWIAASKDAPQGSVDQRTLPFALANTPGVAVDTLHNTYCAVPGDGIVNPIILHDNASKKTPKIPKWVRAFHALKHRASVKQGEACL